MMHTGRTARWAAGELPLTFMAFDLLHLDGQDLTGLPLAERKQLLDDLHLVGPAWTTNGWHPGDGDALVQRVRRAWARRRGGEAPGRPVPARYSVENMAQEKMPRLERRPRPSATATGAGVTPGRSKTAGGSRTPASVRRGGWRSREPQGTRTTQWVVSPAGRGRRSGHRWR